MQPIIWTERMSVGVKLLDNDNKKLILLINHLHDGLVSERAKPELDRIFQRLIRSTRVHFAHEEHLLLETGYPGAMAHKQEHDRLLKQVDELYQRFRAGVPLSIYIDGMDILEDWLANHLFGSDQKYGPFLEARGVNWILTSWEIPAEALHHKPDVQSHASPAAS